MLLHELLQLERALGAINSTQLVAAQPRAVGFQCLESFKALRARTLQGAAFTQVMVNCSWEEVGACGLEHPHSSVGRLQRHQISLLKKVVGNEMQPTLISSMGGAELLGSRWVGYLVSRLLAVREERMSRTPSSRAPLLADSTRHSSGAAAATGECSLEQEVDSRLYQVLGTENRNTHHPSFLQREFCAITSTF